MRRPALVLLGFLMLFGVTATKAQTPGAASKPATGAPNSSVAPKPIHLPLFFEANQGQADSQVRFMARGKGYTLLLTPTETILDGIEDAGIRAVRGVWAFPKSTDRNEDISRKCDSNATGGSEFRACYDGTRRASRQSELPHRKRSLEVADASSAVFASAHGAGVSGRGSSFSRRRETTGIRLCGCAGSRSIEDRFPNSRSRADEN